MINYLYPPSKSNPHNDKRILEYFPELQPFFNDTSIRDLMGVANGRKETRHYENKKTGAPHRSIIWYEAEQFYQRIDVLALSIVRNKLGLPPIIVKM